MTGKPIGTMFVELDLDASRYTKGQQKLLKDAQSASLNIEQNFKNLGIKSAAEMDLMRAKIKNSFDMIANSSKATANDIIRAERAKNEQLAALNRQQFGDQAGMLASLRSNWLAAAASIFAAYKAIGQGADMAAAGAKLEKQSESFKNLSAAAGTSAEQILGELKSISRGMVSEADLMSSAGKAMLMSIPAKDITRLMEIAAATSRSTGQTITEAFGDITLGVARQSKMILDNLGIIVDVDRANQDYAKSLGKTAEALTDAEKRQAFMNSVLKSGDDMMRRIGSARGDLEGANRMVAAHSDLWNQVNMAVAELLDSRLSKYASWLDVITEKLKKLRETGGLSEARSEADLTASLRQWGIYPAGEDQKGNAERARRALSGPVADESRFRLLRGPDAYASWREREGQWTEYTPDELKKMTEAREKFLKDAQAERQKAADETKRQLKALTDEVEKYQLDFATALMGGSRLDEYMAGGQNENAISRMHQERAARLDKELLGQQSDAMMADQQRWVEWKRSIEDSFNFAVELSERTAERMQDNFSDLFFDAFKGELRSLEDYIDAFTNTIQRAMADVAGQMATQAIFGQKSVGSTSSGGGGLLAWLGTLVATESARGNVFGPQGLTAFARGGIVDRPTVFPFARGVGLMGEAGPEAIMPLKRNTRGELGVAGGGIKIEMHNHGTTAEVRDEVDPDGLRRLIINTVAGDIAMGGDVARAQRSYFGSRPRGRY